MIVTLSDYIMEQTVSPASCEDITMEQGLAEMEVYTALANAYAKQILMLEYAAEYTMEADGETATTTEATEEKKNSKFKEFWRTIWEGIKKAIFWLGRKFKEFGGWIKSKFSKKAIDKAQEVADNGTDEEVEALVESITSDYNAAEGATQSSETVPGEVMVNAPAKISALDLAIAYDTSELGGIIKDITSIAEELLTRLTTLTNADTNMSGDKRDSFKETIGRTLKNRVRPAIEKLADAIDKLQMRQLNANASVLYKKGTDKRGLLNKMCKFARYMTEEGYKELDAADRVLDQIARMETSGLQLGNNAEFPEITKELRDLQKTIFNLTKALSGISESTRKLANAIQKEVNDFKGNRVKEMTPEQKEARKKELKAMQEKGKVAPLDFE